MASRASAVSAAASSPRTVAPSSGVIVISISTASGPGCTSMSARAGGALPARACRASSTMSVIAAGSGPAPAGAGSSRTVTGLNGSHPVRRRTRLSSPGPACGSGPA